MAEVSSKSQQTAAARDAGMQGRFIGVFRILEFRLGTAPLTNSSITITMWLYIALSRTPNIDCTVTGGGQYPRFRV